MNMSTSAVEDYDYCTAWQTSDTIDLTGCNQCLEAANQQYLSNCSSPFCVRGILPIK
jgi:hypothetical protein